MIMCTSQDLGLFFPAIQKITKLLMVRHGSYDKLALGRDDYESILMAHAWEGLTRWRSDPSRVVQGRGAEALYVHKMLWTKASHTRRLRKRQNTDVDLVSLCNRDTICDGVDMEESLLLRHTLQRVMDCYTPREWDALCCYLETGRPGPRSKGRGALLRAKNKMSDILEYSLRSK